MLHGITVTQAAFSSLDRQLLTTVFFNLSLPIVRVKSSNAPDDWIQNILCLC